MGLFIDAEGLTSIQLVQIFAVYAYLLYVGCNMISDGAELLMLTPYSKLVGCCILPILGAVPDGAIVLFSGLGPDAQENLDVGVGALAGSTVMLLTIPWGLAIFGGRVNLDENGKPVYDVPRGTPRYSKEPSGVFGRAPKVRKMALWMAATALPYVVVEAGALLAESRGVDDEAKVSLMESNWALAALVLCLVGFVAYLYTQYQAAFGGAQDDILEAQTAKGTRAAVTGYGVGIVAALEPHLHLHTVADADSYQGLRDDEAMPTDAQLKLLRGVLGPYFSKYDADNSNHIEANELGRVFQEMNEPKSTQEIKELFRAYDRDRNGKLTLDEFCAGMLKYAAEKKDDPSVHRNATVAHDSDEEHEEIPDEFAENKFKSVAEQQRAIRGAAARLCLAGTALVLVFSDPITDVLQTGADRMGVPAFYVGFVVAPLITNGSEVLASYTFAQKKTRKAMVVAYEQLLGAAVMNNTFCLAVFAALIYFQDLVWTYTAETVAILFAEICVEINQCAEIAMYVVATQLEVHTKHTAMLVLGIYPAAIAIVWCLENVFGIP